MASAGTPRGPDRRAPSVLGRTWALFALGVTLSGCGLFGAGSQRATQLHPESPAGSWHVVAAGETMAEIAARAGVPLEDLLEINGLLPNEAVPAGRLIFVLAAPADPAAEQVDRQPAAGGASGPLRWPLASPVVSSVFGTRLGRPHEGIDLAAPTGTPVQAAAGGFVLYAGDGIGGYGNMVVLQHPEDLLTVYAHNSLVLVKTGERVIPGQEIARVGQSGRATAPHLHFEVRQGQVPQDPIRYLPPAPVASRAR